MKRRRSSRQALKSHQVARYARIFRGRKGDAVIGSFTIIELLMLATVAIMFTSFINDIRNSTVLEKNFLSRDIALVIDTAYAAPGALKYVYPGDVSPFDLRVESNLVYIKDKDEHDNLAKRYPFAHLGSEQPYADLQEPEDVVIVEGGQQVFINDNPEFDPQWRPPPRGSVYGRWTGSLSCPQSVYETHIKDEDQKEVATEICKIASAYGAPGDLMLALGYHESRLKKDAASPRPNDPGMGIFQLTCDGHKTGVPCIGACIAGTSKVDGGSLNDYLTNWQHNIECGILFFYKSKCGGSHESCLEQSKQYCCKGPGYDQSGTSCLCSSSCAGSVEKDVVYTGYDRGLRGYNGWGCMASSRPPTGPNRRATQSYVESIRATESLFRGCCGS